MYDDAPRASPRRAAHRADPGRLRHDRHRRRLRLSQLLRNPGAAPPPPVIVADKTPDQGRAAAAMRNPSKAIQDRVGDCRASERVVSREEQPVDAQGCRNPVRRASVLPAPVHRRGRRSERRPSGRRLRRRAAERAAGNGRTVDRAPPTAQRTQAHPHRNHPASGTGSDRPARVAASARRSRRSRARRRQRGPRRPALARSAADSAAGCSGRRRARVRRRRRRALRLGARGARPAAIWCRSPRSAARREAQASFRAMQAKYPSALGGRAADHPARRSWRQGRLLPRHGRAVRLGATRPASSAAASRLPADSA